MLYEWRDRENYPANGLRICIDSCSGDLSGRLYSRMSQNGIRFRNTMELLLLADRLFDEKGYPGSSCEKRSFQKQGAGKRPKYSGKVPELRLDSGEIRSKSGEFGHMDIVVHTRMHSGWQGMLLWSEENLEADFRGEEALCRYLIEISKRLQENVRPCAARLCTGVQSTGPEGGVSDEKGQERKEFRISQDAGVDAGIVSGADVVRNGHSGK